jgi:serine protease Do
MRIGIILAGAAFAAGILAAQQPPEPPEAPRAPRAPRTERRVYVAPRGSSYLGVGVADIDAERAKALKLPDVHGAEVKNVADEGPAEKAGLKEGDVILQYNGERVEGTDQLQRMVRETPAGREVKLQIWRNGAAQTVTMTMGSRRGSGFAFADGRQFNFEMPEIRIPPMPPMPDMPSGMMSWRSPALGVESESLSSQLAQYFGVKEGVLVRSVIKGSAAEKAGIKAGDVILKVDTTTVTSPREISSVLRSARGNKRTLPVLIQRDRKEMTVNVTLEDESSTPRRNSIRTVTVSTSC